MTIIHTISELTESLARARQDHCNGIGLVPTMGALHAGHASLVRRSLAENELTVVSIFVNPTQFNDSADLDRYPRTLQADCSLLESLLAETTTHACHQQPDIMVFAPSVEEVYPKPDTRRFSYPPTDSVMEGARRPGHFNGVCQIVSRLFEWCCPDKAYFGEKDFQQIAVIRAMMADLGFQFELVACPIVREESGLALSSRNALLTDDERQTATHISHTLFASVEYARTHSVRETHDWVVSEINAQAGLEVEYFEIVDALSLLPMTAWDAAPHIQGCITVHCGQTPIRLIDNICYR